MEKEGEEKQVNEFLVGSALHRLRRPDRAKELRVDAMRAAAQKLVAEKCVSQDEAWTAVEEAKKRLMVEDTERVRDLLEERGADEERLRHQLSVEGYSHKEVEAILAAAREENHPKNDPVTS